MSQLDFMHNLGLGDLNSGVSSGNEWLKGTGPLTESKTPVDVSVIAQIQNASLEDYEKIIAGAQKAFQEWRSLCLNNRLQWGLLVDRLHGINRSFEKFRKERNWRVPSFPRKSQLGPLRRPNRNN